MSKPSQDAGQTRILLGVISNAHGIKGDVLVRTFTENPEDVAAYGPLSDEAGERHFKLKVVRLTSKGVVCRIDGVGDRNGAEALKGTRLFVARAQLPEPEAGEFYFSDLIGLKAVDPGGAEIGRIAQVMNHGAGDILELVLIGQTESVLVPFNQTFVPNVDLEGGAVTVTLPESDSGDGSDAPGVASDA